VSLVAKTKRQQQRRRCARIFAKGLEHEFYFISQIVILDVDQQPFSIINRIKHVFATYSALALG